MKDRKSSTYQAYKIYLEPEEVRRLYQAIHESDTDTIVYYDNLVQQRKADAARVKATKRSNKRFTWIAALVGPVLFLTLLLIYQPWKSNPPHRTEPYTSGPCNTIADGDRSVKIGDMKVGETGWITRSAVAKDGSGEWIDAGAMAYEGGGTEAAICMQHVANGYKVWLDGHEIDGTRGPGWPHATFENQK